MLEHYLTIIPDKKLTNTELKKISDNFMAAKEENKTIILNDDLIQYIQKSLLWIESINYNLEKEPGLPYYAHSIIDVENSIKLKGIFAAWKQLFENAPKKIKVLDYYVADKPEDRIEYLDRERFVTDLGNAVELLGEAIEKEEYVLYIGV
ncbi:hypothetical protein Q2T76_01625 [Lactobacillus sp. YT155]|uniref:hypothetical protein n=1 Tax=Lactobacillus sp. YT155 TaxID=3060955 RepID=UPI00265DEC7C|nr:hypothetical protein [Lactobacillus sp. YT155]MDO1604751.1 hypothetical protein [Lactobacillus sp. YT155]